MIQTRRSTMTAILLIGIGAAQAFATPTAQEILAAADAVRNPDFSFGLTSTLIEYKNSKQTDTSTLAVYSKADTSNGQFRRLIRFIAPARDANKLMLKSGNDLWFYDPSNKASIRISPQQRLLGQAANGDIVTVNLAKDYQAKLAAEEDTQDGERQTRHCFKLALTANTADVTYHHIDMWIVVFDPTNPFNHTMAVTMGGINHDGIHTRLDQGFNAFFRALAHTDRSTHAQSS